MTQNQGQFSLDDLNHYASRQIDREAKNEIPMFAIVPEGGQTQTLQANLKFGQSFYYRGRVIYSDYADPKLPLYSEKSFIQRWVNKLPALNCWMNRSNKYQIVGLSHAVNRGPLLILDLQVYQQSLFVNHQNLLVSIKDIEGRKHTFHNQMKDMFLLQYRQQKQSLQTFLERQEMVVLQANSPILEKYLGDNEQFCLYEPRNILAVSETIGVEEISGRRKAYSTEAAKILKFKGPGWLFYETEAKAPSVRYGYKFVGFLVIYSVLIAMVELLLT